MKTTTIEALARAFAVRMESEIGRENLLEAVRRNATSDASVCHTHDFCDANIVLAETFEQFGLDALEDIDLCNRVWDVATLNDFWIMP